MMLNTRQSPSKISMCRAEPAHDLAEGVNAVLALAPLFHVRVWWITFPLDTPHTNHELAQARWPAASCGPWDDLVVTTMGTCKNRGVVRIQRAWYSSRVVRHDNTPPAVQLLHEVAHAIVGDDETDTMLWERPVADRLWRFSAHHLRRALYASAPEITTRIDFADPVLCQTVRDGLHECVKRGWAPRHWLEKV